MNKTYGALLAVTSKHTQTGVRDTRPPVRTICAVSITGGTPLWHLSSKSQFPDRFIDLFYL